MAHSFTHPLHLAVQQGDISGIRKILKTHRYNVNSIEAKYGFTPLHVAVKYNQLETAQYLLKHHANVEASTRKNLSPLYIAILNNSVSMLQLLINKGVNLNPIKKFDRKSPLHTAIENANYDMVMILLRNYPPLSFRSEFDSLLALAEKIQDVRIASSLLIHKAIIQSNKAQKKNASLRIRVLKRNARKYK